MDAIRIPKVSNVLCSKSGRTQPGTLHLTAHHLIFSYADTSQPEMWVTYPLINLVTRLPQTLSGQCPISFRCRTFETFSLSFEKDLEALDVFESVKELTVANSVSQLYAFYYTPSPPLSASDGWNLYSPREEFGRMGVGTRSKAWRFTDINKDYSFCSTYPTRLVVPTRISDSTLQYGVKYRSKGRIPALTYLHWANFGSITRSSQPMVGLTNARSIQDEKIVEAMFTSHIAPESRASQTVFGATATNLIIDARPTTNAVANTAKGAGTENMDHYKDCKKAYLGIDNIHSMRDSLNKVVEALRETEALAASVSGDIPGTSAAVLPVDRQVLRRSGWLRHLVAILEGTLIIVRNVHVNNSHVLIHCSDGWDRTSQLSAVSQLCLDPYYRTIRGFQVLIEKDFVSFGHKFLDRCGHLSSEKFFLAPADGAGSGGADVAQALFASVQNRFVGNHHLKETSPVFHQFLETVRNIQRQFPARFEFNERFLRDLHTHLYSCQFGTFLFNSERERRVSGEGTTSVWDYMNSPPQAAQYHNPEYNPALDDAASRAPDADQGVLLPNPKNVRFWNELYGRGDEEMNGRFFTAATVVTATPSATLVESAEDDPAPPTSGTGPATPLTPTPARTPSPLPLSPPPARPAPADLFGSAGGGVRSMWGKLSSGAGAALSVMQDAYGTPRTGPRGSPAPSGELRARGELSAWGASASPSREGSPAPAPVSAGAPSRFEPPRVGQAVRSSTLASLSAGTNPWALPGARDADGLPSALMDNPWSTGSVRAPHVRPPLGDTFAVGDMAAALAGAAPGLPPDPSVALPAPAPAHVRPSAVRGASGGTAEAAAGGPEEAPRPPAPPDDAMDPLGVGMW